MKVEARLLLIIAVFFFGLTIIYGLWSKGEAAGTVMLAASGLLALVPGSYYLWWSKRMDPRAEDNPSANPSDGSGVIGAFPNGSVWPFVFGLGATLTGLAFVYGTWTALLGIGLAVVAMIGVAVESRRGGYV
jgi:hypothetical protein